MIGPVPTSSDVGLLFKLIRKNEYDPRSRQKLVGLHSGAISTPAVEPNSPLRNCAGSKICVGGGLFSTNAGPVISSLKRSWYWLKNPAISTYTLCPNNPR